MESSFSKKVISILGIITVLLFVAIYFVFNEIRLKNEKIAVVEHDLSEKNNRFDHLLSMQNLISNIEPDIEKLNQSIVSKNGDVDFIESLESMARFYNLSIKIDSLTLVSDPQASSSTPLTLKLKATTVGSWTNSYLFFSEIESMPFRIKIEKSSIFVNNDAVVTDTTQATNNTWKGTVELSVLKYQ